MRSRIISIFRGLQVYVLSTSKPLPKGSCTISITTVRYPLVPPEISTDEELVNDKNFAIMEANKKKGGRPPLAESQKKDYVVKLCFDKGQYNLIGYKSKKAGMSKAEYCREASLDNKITPALTSEQLDALRKLSGMANNLNQLAYQANIGHLSDLHSAATQALYEILSLIHQLKK